MSLSGCSCGLACLLRVTSMASGSFPNGMCKIEYCSGMTHGVSDIRGNSWTFRRLQSHALICHSIDSGGLQWAPMYANVCRR